MISSFCEVEREEYEAVARRLAMEKDVGNDRRWSIEDEVSGGLRRERSRTMMDAFACWLRTASQQVLSKSPMGEAVTEAGVKWAAICRYIEVPFLAIDNNAGENALRLIAVGRKNWLHLGTDAGGRTAAVLRRLLHKCKMYGVEP